MKITVRELSNDDISERKLPNQTKGLVITNIENDSPLSNSIEINSIIVEAQKKRIGSAKELEKIVEQTLKQIKKQFYLLSIIVKIKEDILVSN